MATFPKLKTEAVMQYPGDKTLQFSNTTLRFLDGSEQRYRESRSTLHRWGIRLDLVDEAELAAIEEFFLSNQGSFGSFSFIDPWDGVTYPDCSLNGDSVEFELSGEMRGQVELVVRENRS